MSVVVIAIMGSAEVGMEVVGREHAGHYLDGLAT